jgi:hypothetical protein
LYYRPDITRAKRQIAPAGLLASGSSSGRAFPPFGSGIMRLSSPDTAAGPHPILTGFPIISRQIKTWTGVPLPTSYLSRQLYPIGFDKEKRQIGLAAGDIIFKFQRPIRISSRKPQQGDA